MKIERLTEHVWQCSMRLVIPIQVWVVESGEGSTLIDAGIPAMAGPLIRFLGTLKSPLRRIVLTHGHSDHVGALAKIRKAYPVPVYAHTEEFPYMEGRKPYPRRSRAQQSVEPGLALPLPEADGKLQPIGGLVPSHTPGHSPGHTAYYHPEDRILLAGDLFTSKRGQLRRPMAMFTADMARAVESGAVVKELKPCWVAICHGGKVANPHEQYDAYRDEALKRL